MPAPTLLDQVRTAMRRKHAAIRTETAYVPWVKRSILFPNKRHPNEMGGAEVEAFLTHLAGDEHVSASTHNPALSARLVLSQEVLHTERGTMDSVRARTDKHVPSVLTRDAVRQRRPPDRRACRDGQAPLWQRIATVGMPAPAR